MAKTLSELDKAYHELFYVEDEVIFKLILSLVVGAKLNAPPVWLFLIGSTSAGKSTALSVLYQIPYVTLISDLTPNTLLSGMRVAGQETSLLKKLGDNFVVVMKDFTTMISKADDAKQQIIAQMREVFDGHISKETGNGHRVEWGTKEKPNKGMFLMAATEGIYKIQSDFSDMGTRAVNYVLPHQDERKSAKAALKNKRNHAESTAKLQRLQKDVAEFVLEMVANAPTEFAPIPEELEDDIISVAMLAERARSVVDRTYQGEVNLALSSGMPMRMSEQLMALAQFMTYVNGGELTPAMRDTIAKVAFDSVPKQRKLILEIVAKYNRTDIIGIAQEINYPHGVVRKWVEDLNMFKILDRSSDGRREVWTIREEYRGTLVKFLGVKPVDGDLFSGGDVSMGAEESWEEKEQRIASELAFSQTL